MNLEVAWPDGHKVKVEVIVEPPLGYMGAGGAGGRALDDADAGVILVNRTHDFDYNVLYDDTTLRAALRRWTLTATGDSVVRAQVVSTRLPKLLELLHVNPPIPDPIQVALSDG